MGKRRPSNFCSFQNCKKNSLSDGIHLFRFPKEKNRCQAWVDSCKNPKLVGIPAEKLNKNFRVCCDHFNDWCFMNTTFRNSLVHNAIPDAPDPRCKIKIEKEENSAEASTANNILLKSPCLLAHLLQSPNSSQYTLIGNALAYSDMSVETSTTDHSSTECFPAPSPILNDQLSSSHVLPMEENRELHHTAPDSADKSTTRRRKYISTKAKLTKKLKHYKDSLRKLKSKFSSYKKKKCLEKNLTNQGEMINCQNLLLVE